MRTHHLFQLVNLITLVAPEQKIKPTLLPYFILGFLISLDTIGFSCIRLGIQNKKSTAQPVLYISSQLNNLFYHLYITAANSMPALEIRGANEG